MIRILLVVCTLTLLAWHLPRLSQREKSIQTLSPAVSRPYKPPDAKAVGSSVQIKPLRAPVATAQEYSTLPLRNIVPSQDDIRSEVANDPHTTPPSLLTFSLELYKKHLEARKSTAKVREYFEELRACVLGELSRVSRNTEALCLQNARKLSAEHPWLGTDYERLVQRADPATVKLIRGLPI